MDDKLLISFERKNRVDLYSTRGRKLKEIKLHKKLKHNRDFSAPNRGLESVSYSPKYGVVTIPETPLKSKKSDFHTLYAKKKSWSFYAKGKISSIEFIDDEKLLLLIRNKALVTVDLSLCQNGLCMVKHLTEVSGSFEGVAKVGKKRFLAVDDNDGSFFKKTHLVLFELRD